MTIRGTRGNDTLNGTSGDDIFDLWQGGNDAASGGDGHDVFHMGRSLNAADRIDGGNGADLLVLNGDYSAGLVFDADTITNIERIRLNGGHDYNLTLNDGNVAAGETLTINAKGLGSGDHFIFDGSAELDGHFTIYGGRGDDTITGGALADTIVLGRGGNDTVHAGGGDDIVNLKHGFTAADTIDGGTGNDTVLLDGMGDDSVSFTATTMTNVEKLVLDAGSFYTLTTDDATVAKGATLIVDASNLTAADPLAFNGAAETDGRFDITAGAGDDTLTGGALSDNFNVSKGGEDSVFGGGGDDTVYFGAGFDTDPNSGTGDSVDGGGGFDTVVLNGDIFAQLLPATFVSVEKLVVEGPHNYNIQSDDGDVAAGDTMIVDGSALNGSHSLTFIGSSETDGTWDLVGGAGGDQLVGGFGNDTIQGNGGRDVLTGNGGSDTFVYAQVSDSTGTGYDQITDVDFSNDKIMVDTGIPNAIDPTIADGFIDADHFNSSLQATVGAAQLGAGDAVLLLVTAGEFAGQAFLIVDHNGIAGYQANQDYVINVTGFAGTLTTDSFTS